MSCRAALQPSKQAELGSPAGMERSLSPQGALEGLPAGLEVWSPQWILEDESRPPSQWQMD